MLRIKYCVGDLENEIIAEFDSKVEAYKYYVDVLESRINNSELSESDAIGEAQNFFYLQKHTQDISNESGMVLSEVIEDI